MKMDLDEARTGDEIVGETPGEDAFEEELLELVHPKLKENKVLLIFVTALAVVALLCLLGLVYYLTHHGTITQAASTRSASNKKSTTGGTSAADLIDVVKVTDVVFENGYLEVPGSNGNFADSTSSKTGGTAGSGSTGTSANSANTGSAASSGYSVESEAGVAARLAAYSSGSTASPSTSSSSGSIVGADEDIARATLKKKGYTVSSVYVCDSAALQGTSAKPKPGRVLSNQTYLGRTEGEKYAFLNVATSASYSTARTVPNLVGKQWGSARSTLNGRGLNIKYLYEQNSSSPYGSVVFQAPAAGASLSRGCSVIVVLAD